MTLTNRNRCFRAGIIFCAVSLLVTAAAVFMVMPAYPQALEGSIRCTAGIIQRIIANFTGASPYIPFISMASSVVFSLIGITLIYYFFEKTQSPEIIFIGLFVVSFAFECIRIIIPLKIIYDLPIIYLTNSTRVLFFGRFFGLFSFFSASLYTAGLKIQKQHYIILVCAITSFIFALGVPVDGLSWDSTLVLLNDFDSTFYMIQVGIYTITIASFMISAYTRGSKEYISIGIGALLILLGRNMLFCSDTWVSPFPGLFILSFGTWLVCIRFHRLYLWL